MNKCQETAAKEFVSAITAATLNNISMSKKQFILGDYCLETEISYIYCMFNNIFKQYCIHNNFQWYNSHRMILYMYF